MSSETKTKKKLKKNSEKTTEQKSKPTEISAVPNECVYLVMSQEELKSLTALLSFSKSAYKLLAERYLKDGDANASHVLDLNAKISETLHSKFQSLLDIGEPISRNVH